MVYSLSYVWHLRYKTSVLYWDMVYHTNPTMLISNDCSLSVLKRGLFVYKVDIQQICKFFSVHHIDISAILSRPSAKVCKLFLAIITVVLPCMWINLYYKTFAYHNLDVYLSLSPSPETYFTSPLRLTHLLGIFDVLYSSQSMQDLKDILYYVTHSMSHPSVKSTEGQFKFLLRTYSIM